MTLHTTTPTPLRPRTRLADVVATEGRTHLQFAGVLLGVGVAAPLLAAGIGLMSPAVAEMVTLGASSTVAVSDVARLQGLLLRVFLLVLAASFAARVLLVPGRAAGRLASDILRRRSTRTGAILAGVNFVALWGYTDVVAEVWVFPVLVFSVCQVSGVLLERLRHPGDLAW